MRRGRRAAGCRRALESTRGRRRPRRGKCCIRLGFCRSLGVSGAWRSSQNSVAEERDRRGWRLPDTESARSACRSPTTGGKGRRQAPAPARSGACPQPLPLAPAPAQRRPRDGRRALRCARRAQEQGRGPPALQAAAKEAAQRVRRWDRGVVLRWGVPLFQASA
jgi:hypothetical protein